MDIGEARAIAQQHLDSSGFTEQGQRLVVFPYDEMVEDLGWCYLFHYNTERYIETDDPGAAMGPGRGPIAVAKKDGATYETGSAPGYKERIAELGRAHGYVYQARTTARTLRPGRFVMRFINGFNRKPEG